LKQANLTFNTKKGEVEFKVRLDRSIDESVIMRLLGFLWQKVETYSKQHGELKDTDRLLSSKPDGCRYLIRDDDVFELFVVKRDGPAGAFQVVPTTGLSQFKIGIHAASSMIEAAKARIDNIKVRSDLERLNESGAPKNSNADLDSASDSAMCH